jgi:Bacterial signalling protein N terminal repeat
MIATYNFWLVALSIGIAILASYTALDLASRVGRLAEQNDRMVGSAQVVEPLQGARAQGNGMINIARELGFGVGTAQRIVRGGDQLRRRQRVRHSGIRLGRQLPGYSNYLLPIHKAKPCPGIRYKSYGLHALCDTSASE